MLVWPVSVQAIYCETWLAWLTADMSSCLKRVESTFLWMGFYLPKPIPFLFISSTSMAIKSLAPLCTTGWSETKGVIWTLWTMLALTVHSTSRVSCESPNLSNRLFLARHGTDRDPVTGSNVKHWLPHGQKCIVITKECSINAQQISHSESNLRTLSLSLCVSACVYVCSPL